jgi:alpha-tubulin suppressor-like RCC1 family protein
MNVTVKSFNGDSYNINLPDNIEHIIFSLRQILEEEHNITDVAIYKYNIEVESNDTNSLIASDEYYILPKRNIISIKFNKKNICILYSTGELFLYNIDKKSYCGTFKNIKDVILLEDDILFLEKNGKIYYINSLNNSDSESDDDTSSYEILIKNNYSYKYNQLIDIQEPIEKISYSDLIGFKSLFNDTIYILSLNQSNLIKIPLYKRSNIKNIFAINDNSIVLLTINNKILISKLINTNDIEVTEYPEYDVENVIVGINNLFIILKNGRVFAKGENSFGQLGMGGNNYINEFKEVLLPTKIIVTDIYSSKFHTGFVTKNGSVFMCGNNSNYQFGILSDQNISSTLFLYPNYLKLEESIKQIYGNTNYTVLISENNQLYVVGKNDYGKLGLAHFDNVLSPTFVEIENEPSYSIKNIHCDEEFIVIVLENNKIMYSGKNPFLDEETNVFIEFDLPV